MRLAPGGRLGVSSLPREVGGVPGRAGGGGPCGVVELPKNRLQDVVQPTQDVICGEPEHPEPATHQPGGPSTVVFNSIVVTRAVDLDQQPRLEAGEVGNVRTDGRLPPEPVALKLLAA